MLTVRPGLSALRSLRGRLLPGDRRANGDSGAVKGSQAADNAPSVEGGESMNGAVFMDGAAFNNSTGPSDRNGRTTGEKSAPGLQAGVLARSLPTVSSQTTAEAAFSLFTAHQMTALPVVDGAAAVGYVAREDLIRHVGGLREWQAGSEQVHSATCGGAVRPYSAAVPAETGQQELAVLFDATGQPLIPVLGEHGILIGYVLPSDLLAPCVSAANLPMVGGMATPFGVYLASDGIGAGVGFFPLVATGVILGIGAVIASALTGWLLSHLDAAGWGPYARAMISIGQGGRDVLNEVMTLLIFLTMIRLTPVAGYHAAEHQTVHTIEAHEPLTPERVRMKPRVHPRCGTNFMIMVALMFSLSRYAFYLGDIDIAQYVLVGGMLLILALRLTLGGYAQQFFTTRPASDKQIASGIKAATQLAERYSLAGRQDRTIWARLWSMGLAQVFLGLFIASTVASDGLALWQRVGSAFAGHLPWLQR